MSGDPQRYQNALAEVAEASRWFRRRHPRMADAMHQAYVALDELSKERDRLAEAVRVCGRHLCDCCRSDIDWKLQIETHNQAVNAVGWIENFDRLGPVTRRHAPTEYDITGREQG